MKRLRRVEEEERRKQDKFKLHDGRREGGRTCPKARAVTPLDQSGILFCASTPIEGYLTPFVSRTDKGSWKVLLRLCTRWLCVSSASSNKLSIQPELIACTAGVARKYSGM